MITIINEKSSQAKNFAAALGGVQGTLPNNANLAGQYAIDYAAGHLVTFKPLEEMVPKDVIDDYLTWDYNRLPFDRTKINWQVRLNPDCGGRGAKFYMTQFKRDLARSDTAIIATDLDKSGEGNLIGWEILNYCHFQGDVYRCEHADETVNGITTAFTKLKLLRKAGGPINDPLYRKAQARTKFDFLTIQYVRIITDEAQKISILPSEYVPRSGRLKAAMLELIGHQEKLHDYFKPHSDFQPVLYDQDGHRFTPDSKKAPFYQTEAEAQQHLGELPQNAVSVEIATKDLVQKPPKMLNLSQVAARLANKGYNSKKVEQLAETLYRAGILSYPRTDENYISVDQLQELVPLIPKICQIIGIDQNLLDTSHYRSYLIGNGTHGANRPGLNVPNSLADLRNDYGDTAVALYDELARSFLAGFGSDKLAKKHIYADDKTKSYFASCLEITDPGFSLILHDTKEKDDSDSDDSKAPFTVGQALKPGVWEKKATRPALATQAKVSSYLRKNNIGTGATQLKTFNDITDNSKKSRQLVMTKNKGLRLTRLGQISYLAMYGTDLASPKTTQTLEEWLDNIAAGKLNENQFLVFFDKMIVHDKRIILDNHKNLVTLPKVKQTTHQKISGVFKPTGKKVSINNGYGTYTYTKAEVEKLFNGEEITFPYGQAKVTGKLANRGEKYGFGFQGKFSYPKADKATGYSALARQDVSFNKTFAGHTFTQSEIDSLLDGNAVSFAAKSKAGKKYTARVHLENSPLYKAKTNKKVWHIGFVKA